MSSEPAIPVVDLPRVDSPRFQFYDHTVGAYLVTDDDAMARWIDELTSHPRGTIAADIETRGLDAAKFAITCVTVAFHLGADTVSLLLDPLRRPEHRGMLARVFDHARTLVFHGATFDIAPLYAHRLMTRQHIRKVADTLVAARMIRTYAKAGRTLEDLSTAYWVMNDDRMLIQEVFAARGLKKDQGYFFTDIDTPTYVVGAMADTVATLRLWGTPDINGSGIAAAAARYLSSAQLGLGGLGVLNAGDAMKLVDDVQQVNRIVLERTARGYAVDPEFRDRFRTDNEQEWVAAAKTLAAARIRPGNGADLINVLAARGEIDLALWPRTPKGQLKADKNALSVFDVMDSSRSELVAAHQKVANSEKILGYLTKVVENSRPTGRLHPEIKILGANATGRMCLPKDQRLLTRRGVVAVDDIRIGDRTIGADGEWTTVRAVHRYPSAPLRRYTLDDGTELVCTPEHRWVTQNAAGDQCVQPLDADPSVSVRLAPASVADIPPNEAEAFLLGGIEASKTEPEGQRLVTAPTRAYADAFAVAGYRAGYASRTVDAPDGRTHVLLQPPLRPIVAAEDTEPADVWCVTTDSGTFTAWGDDGPYLTGNSAANPEIQQFPAPARGIILADPGHEWISADWKSIEPVVLATASGDAGFLADMRAGKDPYEPVGQMAGIDRKLAKRKMLADMYGQGAKAAALQYGWTEERAKQVARAIRDGLPILYRLIDQLKRQSRTSGYVTTLSGRVVDQQFSRLVDGRRVDETAERIAPNHFCQGSALDIMHHSILELDRRGLSDHVHLWMHDEIVADQEIEAELAEVMATAPPFLLAAAHQQRVEPFLAVDVNPLGSRWQYV